MRRWLLLALVATEVLAVLVLCVRSVQETPVFGTGDEGYHLAYAVSIAEGRGLPVVGRTAVDPEVLAIQDGTYPGPPVSVDGLGFRGQSYEAFQPPLYYALAAPFTLLREDWLDKVRVLRLFAVGLIAAALALLYGLCRLVRQEGPLTAYALALLPFLTPAFRQQEVLVSNDALVVPLVLAFAGAAWAAAVRCSRSALAGAALLLGLLLLTKLTAVWAAAVLGLVLLRVLLAQPTWPRRVVTVLTGLVPGLLLAPWLLHNLRTYDALTANALVLELQQEVSPSSFPSVVDQLRVVHEVLVQVVLGRQDRYATWVPDVAFAVTALLLVAVLGVLLRRPLSPAAVVLALPLPLQLGLLSVLSVREGQQLLYERYLHPVVPLAVLALVVGLRRGGPLEDEQVVEAELERPVLP